MKRIAAIIVSVCILACLFPSTAFASDSLLEDLLAKLQSMVEEGSEDKIPEDSLAEQGQFSARALYEEASPKVVEINVADRDGNVFASGSGFFINDQGDIVTNYHVIEDAYNAFISLENGDVYDEPYVLAYDKNIDLAVLRIGTSGNEFLKIATEPVQTGDTIYTLGSALGLTGTFSDGLVATASRVIDGADNIQITAPISSGNSGGPLINSRGEVVGVNTWGYVDGQNVNFAVNIHEMSKLDFSDPITMHTFYAREAGTGGGAEWNMEIDDADLQAWMEDTDYVEAETNDDFDCADVLANDTWMAGTIGSIEDFDFYGMILTDPATISALILPYYEEDADYLLAALVSEAGDILTYAEPVEYQDMHFLDLEWDAEEAGVYYLVLCVADEYPYDSPVYYQTNASW